MSINQHKSSSTTTLREPSLETSLLEAIARLGSPAALFDGHGVPSFKTAAFDSMLGEPGEPRTEKRLAQLIAAITCATKDFRLQLAGLETFELRCERVDGGRWLVTALREQSRDAHTDILTGLGDRHVLRQKILGLYAAGEQDYWLLQINLDRFKIVNDTLGHPVGDKLLRLAAQRIKRLLTDADLLVRTGGDEFIILRWNTGRDAVAELAARLVDLVSRSYIVEQHVINVGASVGVAHPSQGEGDPDRLITLLDLALCAAKESGRGRSRFFEPALETRAQERRSLEQDLRRGLALRQFELFYQPQVDAGSGRITGLEALVRWRHPQRGLVSPTVFIPIAEDSGSILQLGEWILRTACRDAARWPDDVTLAVNLSAIQVLDPQLAPTVVQALARSGLPPHRLELEITETALIRDMTAAFATLKQLKGLGVQIAMDDFGTGYSSLSYLRAFPFNKVKIDQSFVREMLASSESAAIVKAVVDLGDSLSMKVTAEGVETREQIDMLRALGCGQLQGYHFSRPAPLNEIEKLLEREDR